MYILIVEDDPFLAYDLCEAITTLHADIRTARSVRDAMSLFRDGMPLVAILDFNLGSETSRDVAVRLARENVPFCFVTADGDGVRDDPALTHCPVLTKPYRIEDVRAVAKELLLAGGY